MEMELKPCPFCGSKRVSLAWSLNDDERGIHCIDCDAFMNMGWFEVKDEELVRVWNRRAKDDASD